jgi:hypothetical protein
MKPNEQTRSDAVYNRHLRALEPGGFGDQTIEVYAAALVKGADQPSHLIRAGLRSGEAIVRVIDDCIIVYTKFL